MSWETIHTEDLEGFHIEFAVAPEDMDPADSFEFPEDIEAVRSGKWLWFQVRCTASKAGVVLGSDYLGGCAYETYADFLTPDGYAADMRTQAIAEARAKLAEIAQ